MKKTSLPLIMNYIKFNEPNKDDVILKSNGIEAYNSERYFVLSFYKDITRLI